MTAVARIFQPAKTATQSGRAGLKHWRLEFDPALERFIEPLMGWTGTRNTLGQISMRFASKEAAIAFAEKHNVPYRVEEPKQRRLARRLYADNFSFDRLK